MGGPQHHEPVGAGGHEEGAIPGGPHLGQSIGREGRCRASAAQAPSVDPVGDPHAFVEHVVLFPLGESGVRSPATSPLPGRLLAVYAPDGAALATAGLVAAAVKVAVSLLIRPPRTVRAAADRLTVGWFRRPAETVGATPAGRTSPRFPRRPGAWLNCAPCAGVHGVLIIHQQI